MTKQAAAFILNDPIDSLLNEQYGLLETPDHLTDIVIDKFEETAPDTLESLETFDIQDSLSENYPTPNDSGSGVMSGFVFEVAPTAGYSMLNNTGVTLNESITHYYNWP